MHVALPATVQVIKNTKYRLEVELGGCVRRLLEGWREVLGPTVCQ